jgi:hypothetical protein
VGLIERWVDRPMTGSLFVREWDRISGASPGVAAVRDPVAKSPPVPDEPTEIQDSQPAEEGLADEGPDSAPKETSVDDGSDGPEQTIEFANTGPPPSEDGESPWPKRVLIAVVMLGLLFALLAALNLFDRSREEYSVNTPTNDTVDAMVANLSEDTTADLNGTATDLVTDNTAAAATNALDSIDDGGISNTTGM